MKRPKANPSLEVLEDRTLLSTTPIASVDLSGTQQEMARIYQGILSGDIRSDAAIPSGIDSNGYLAELLALKHADEGAGTSERSAENAVAQARQQVDSTASRLGSTHAKVLSLRGALLQAQGEKATATDRLAALTEAQKELAAQQNLELALAPSQQMWSADARTALPSIEGADGSPFQRIDLSPNGMRIAALRSDGQISIFETQSGKLLKTIETGLQDNRGIAWAPDSISFAICGKIDARNDWKLQVWNAQSGTMTWQQSFGSVAVTSTSWGSDGKIVSGSLSPGQSLIYDAITGREISRMAISSAAHASALSPDGSIFYVEVRPGITAFDAKTGAALRSYGSIGGEMWSIAPSPNGKYLLGGGAEGELCLYEAATGALLSKIWDKGGSITGIDWNADSTAFAISRANMATPGVTIFKFEGATPRQVQFIAAANGVEATLLSSRFARDGKSIVINESSWGPSALSAATLVTEAQTSTQAASPVSPDELKLQIAAAQADAAAAQAAIDDRTMQLSTALQSEAADALAVENAQAALTQQQGLLDMALATFSRIDGLFTALEGSMYEALSQTQQDFMTAQTTPPPVEMVDVTPTLHFTLVNGTYHVDYTDMPAHMSWQITKVGQLNYVVGGEEIPEGSGTFVIAPAVRDQQVSVILRDGTTDAVTDLHLVCSVGTYQIAQGSPTPTLTLGNLTHSVPKDGGVSSTSSIPIYDALVAQLGTYPNLRRELEDQCVEYAGVWPDASAEALVQRGYPQLPIGSAAYWENVRGVSQDMNEALTLVHSAVAAAFQDLLAIKTGQPLASGDSVTRALYTQNAGVAWVLSMQGITPDGIRKAMHDHFNEAYDEAARLQGIQQTTIATVHAEDIKAEQAYEALQLAAMPTPWSTTPYSGYVLGNPADRVAIDPSMAGLPPEVVAAYQAYQSTVANHVRAALQSTNNIAATDLQQLVEGTYKVGEFGGSDPAIQPLSSSVLLDRAKIIGSIPPEAQQAAMNLAGTSRREMYSQVESWYDAQHSPLIQSLTVRRDTVAGRLLFGAFNRLFQETTAYGQWYDALQMEAITDIPASKIMEVANTSSNGQTFVSRALSLVSEAQYSHLLQAQPTGGAVVGIISATPDLPQDTPYTSGNVRIRFDVATNGQEVLYATAKLSDGRVVGTSASALFLDVPVSSLGLTSSSLKLTIQITLSDGRILTAAADPISVKPQDTLSIVGNGDYSTLPAGIEHDRENSILSQLIQNFPLQNAASWRWDIASDLHVGAAYNAVDLNLGSGPYDEGQEVRADAPGTLHIDTNYGTVIINHDGKQENGPDLLWQTKFLHLRVFETGRTDSNGKAIYDLIDTNNNIVKELTEGMTVAAGDLVGLVGGKGPKGYDQFSPHLHLEILANGESIDLRRVLFDTLGMKVTATDGGADGSILTDGDNVSTSVTWNDDVQGWVAAVPNLQTTGVYFSHQDQQNAKSQTPAYWYAWAANPEDRKEIVWVHQLKDGRIIDCWRQANDYSKKWNSQNQKWESL